MWIFIVIAILTAILIYRWSMRLSARTRQTGVRWQGIDWSAGREDDDAPAPGEASATKADDRHSADDAEEGTGDEGSEKP